MFGNYSVVNGQVRAQTRDGTPADRRCHGREAALLQRGREALALSRWLGAAARRRSRSGSVAMRHRGTGRWL